MAPSICITVLITALLTFIERLKSSRCEIHICFVAFLLAPAVELFSAQRRHQESTGVKPRLGRRRHAEAVLETVFDANVRKGRRTEPFGDLTPIKSSAPVAGGR